MPFVSPPPVAAFAALLVLSTSSSVCSANENGAFRSPSGAIGCRFSAQQARCEVKGSVPRPAHLRGCDFALGRGYTLGATGPAKLHCPTDSTFGGPALPFGASTTRYGITCGSSPNGIRCTNAARRGFSISRGPSFMF